MLCIISYLLGSIPFGFLITKLVKNIDIRDYGSGNIGATNVTRVLGKPFGVLVFVLDFLKGFIPVFLANIFFKLDKYEIMLVGLFVVFGHNWPFFLKFKGGKGITVSLAILVGLSFIFNKLWICIILGIIIWIIIFLISRYVSIASLTSSLLFFIASIFLVKDKFLNIFIFLLISLIVIRHKRNIKNLINGKELRFSRR